MSSIVGTAGGDERHDGLGRSLMAFAPPPAATAVQTSLNLQPTNDVKAHSLCSVEISRDVATVAVITARDTFDGHTG